MSTWQRAKVLVTGGASFIGSHLVDRLVERGASVRVADDLSSGSLENIQGHVNADRVEFLEVDLRDSEAALRACQGVQTVFHLAADHGGRGYVDLHQTECATNFILDGQVFRAAERAGVEKVVFASSACAYPVDLQGNPAEELYLSEDLIRPPYHADNLYGWAKLMGELTLRAYCEKGAFQAANCRLFTVYGPRCRESHAVLAMIARAFLRQDPFEVWGTGEQVRNWTFVDDTVEGLIRSAERIDDGSAVNLGTMERIRVADAARMAMELSGYAAPIRFRPDMPTGPYNRVADNARARNLLGWEPRVPFKEGLRRTIDWYAATQVRDEVAARLERALTERIGTSPKTVESGAASGR